MAKPILMPQVGQDLTEGKLIEWRIKVGDSVGKGDIVAVVESEKASFEVEAFEAGTVLQLLYEEGATTEVLAPLAFLGTPGEVPGAPQAPVEAEAPTLPKVAAPEPTPVVTPPAPAAPAASTATKANGVRKSSPLARRLARENALDLAALTGSGPQGAIVKRDIAAAMIQRQPATAAVAPTPAFAGGTLHRVWLRKGSGDPLVMIHGFGAELNGWRGFVAAAALSRPILALDLPGHGKSAARETISTEPLSWDGMVCAIAATLAQEGIEAADLVGHSLGAALAVSLAEAARFTVRSLFLIAPAGLGPDIDGAFLAGFLRAETEASLAPWMRRLVSDEGFMGPAFVSATAQTRSQPGVRSGQDGVARTFFPDGTQAISVRKTLGGLSCPVRIVFGAQDKIIPAHHASGLPGTVAVHMFPGLGHMPHIEARDEVARLLRHHIASVG